MPQFGVRVPFSYSKIVVHNRHLQVSGGEQCRRQRGLSPSEPAWPHYLLHNFCFILNTLSREEIRRYYKHELELIMKQFACTASTESVSLEAFLFWASRECEEVRILISYYSEEELQNFWNIKYDEEIKEKLLHSIEKEVAKGFNWLEQKTQKDLLIDAVKLFVYKKLRSNLALIENCDPQVYREIDMGIMEIGKALENSECDSEEIIELLATIAENLESAVYISSLYPKSNEENKEFLKRLINNNYYVSSNPKEYEFLLYPFFKSSSGESLPAPSSIEYCFSGIKKDPKIFQPLRVYAKSANKFLETYITSTQ